MLRTWGALNPGASAPGYRVRSALGANLGNVYFPVATMRLAFVGSVPRLTVTAIPGFKSATVAFWPFTTISVNWLIINVFVAAPSVTVIEVAVTLAIVGTIGAGVGFFFEALNARLVADKTTRQKIRYFFILFFVKRNFG